MTPTAQELWNDEIFILRRILEQNQYIGELDRKRIRAINDAYFGEHDVPSVVNERHLLLRNSAVEIRERLLRRRDELWDKKKIAM